MDPVNIYVICHQCLILQYIYLILLISFFSNDISLETKEQGKYATQNIVVLG